MIRGMTGFGRAQGQADWGAWTWEARSVNGRSIDVRVATPPGLDVIEFEARKRTRERFQRGSFQLQLRVEFHRSVGDLHIDSRELARMARLGRSWEKAGLARPSLSDLIDLKAASRAGARAGEGLDEAIVADLLAGLEQAFAALIDARRKEGEALQGVLSGLVDQIEGHARTAGSLAASQPEIVRERFRARVAELAGPDMPIDPDRLLQEAALMAGRADVREELDRLAAHIASARTLLAGPEPAGRKLDFLCQELNREANTLCSKSASLELTNAGLALKSSIEQFREQVQNVE